MSRNRVPLCAGFDIGGTKIEATLFDTDLQPIRTSRCRTPRESYDELFRTLVETIAEVRASSGQPDLPVGLGFPGLVDPLTGEAMTSNLPATGRPIARDLKNAVGGTVVAENDCKCFALSEANGGSGKGSGSVFGLILGTGLGGGMCHHGKLLSGLNNIAGEIGHFAVPAHLFVKHGLPLRVCGCGRTGCFETLVSGTGLVTLCRTFSSEDCEVPEIAERAAAGDAEMVGVMNIWAELAGELLHTLQLHLDPEVIVLGGGLSNIAGIELKLAEALERAALPALRRPAIRKPAFGDSSGGRGAAILALEVSRGEAR
ncbi:MAG: ROK family protein [Geminicoccaceae bacterium]